MDHNSDVSHLLSSRQCLSSVVTILKIFKLHNENVTKCLSAVEAVLTSILTRDDFATYPYLQLTNFQGRSSYNGIPSLPFALNTYRMRRGGEYRSVNGRRSSAVGIPWNSPQSFHRRRSSFGPMRRNRANMNASPRQTNLRPLMSIAATPPHSSTPIENSNSRPNLDNESDVISEVNFDSSQMPKKDEVVEEPSICNKIMKEKVDASTSTETDQGCERKGMEKAMSDLLEKMQEFKDRYCHKGREKSGEKVDDISHQSRSLPYIEDISEEVAGQSSDPQVSVVVQDSIVNDCVQSVLKSIEDIKREFNYDLNTDEEGETYEPQHQPIEISNLNKLSFQEQSSIEGSKTDNASNEVMLPPPAKKTKVNGCTKNKVQSSSTVTTPRLSARIRQRTEQGSALLKRAA